MNKQILIILFSFISISSGILIGKQIFSETSEIDTSLKNNKEAKIQLKEIKEKKEEREEEPKKKELPTKSLDIKKFLIKGIVISDRRVVSFEYKFKSYIKTEGDKFDDYKIIKIEKDYIIVNDNGKEIRVEMNKNKPLRNKKETQKIDTTKIIDNNVYKISTKDSSKIKWRLAKNKFGTVILILGGSDEILKKYDIKKGDKIISINSDTVGEIMKNPTKLKPIFEAEESMVTIYRDSKKIERKIKISK